LIYTSGSTGKPKAVMVTHRSLVNRLSAPPLPDIQAGDVCAWNSSLSFGISASRLLLPLALGLTVVVIHEDAAADVTHLMQLVESQRITSMFLVPDALRSIFLQGSDCARRLKGLRAVAVGGSALTPEIATMFFSHAPESILVNLYGGSEIGTTATLRVLTRNSDPSFNSIGRPVANTVVHLIDGEICVEAPHLARGYLNQDALTEERFGLGPGGERMYRTGDLGELLSNGEIGYLGRADQQVKVRGFRIELGEIEAALASNSHIKDAVVLAHDMRGAKRLTAYISRERDGVPSSRTLRTYLTERLPEFMIPASFVFLPELPRTHNGKIDRGALPLVDPSRPDLDIPYVAPRSASETTLAAIWSDVLGIRSVGVEDHFLDLGGDSLLATQILSRLQDEHGARIDFTAFFEQGTVAAMAAQL
jgi:acyl-coenzyme A synthetase/AMP-(fatty) acid ligase/acyl carrier protein